MSDVIQPTPLTRVRVIYGKTGNLRYVGNLDMHTVWERTLRRAGLPLAYTKGFSPRPRFQLASALPMGAVSRCELMDAWLENPPAVDQIQSVLQRSAPPGLEIVQVNTVDLSLPALQNQLLSSEYIITLPDAMNDLAERVAFLQAAESLPREWRGKAYNLRPLVEEIQLLSGQPARLFLRLTAREGATGRPEEVLSSLGLDPLSGKVERVKLNFKE